MNQFMQQLMKKLDPIPSSCIILMVHVVKGRQYSTSHINTGTSITETESETDSQPQQGQVSMFQSQEMNLIAQCIQLYLVGTTL